MTLFTCARNIFLLLAISFGQCCSVFCSDSNNLDAVLESSDQDGNRDEIISALRQVAARADAGESGLPASLEGFLKRGGGGSLREMAVRDSVRRILITIRIKELIEGRNECYLANDRKEIGVNADFHSLHKLFPDFKFESDSSVDSMGESLAGLLGVTPAALLSQIGAEPQRLKTSYLLDNGDPKALLARMMQTGYIETAILPLIEKYLKNGGDLNKISQLSNADFVKIIGPDFDGIRYGFYGFARIPCFRVEAELVEFRKPLDKQRFVQNAVN